MRGSNKLATLENTSRRSDDVQAISKSNFHSNNQNNKKISLNHLLNFSFPPRQPATNHPVSAANNRPSRRQKPLHRKEDGAFTKERFINASFRFVVKPDGDYRLQLLDPDVPIEWTSVEQVIVTAADFPSCPICLNSPPIAPRMTKCGHIFCYHCILQYHTIEPYEDRPRDVPSLRRKWRKCPMCYESTYEAELKSVRFWTVYEPFRTLPHSTNDVSGIPESFWSASTGALGSTASADAEAILRRDPEYARIVDGRPLGTINLTLVVRRAGSVLVSPFLDGYHVLPHHPPLHSNSHALMFARFIASSKSYLLNEMLKTDLGELKHEMEQALKQKPISNKLKSSTSDQALQQEIMFYTMTIDKLNAQIAAADKAPDSSSTNGTRRKSNPTKHGDSENPPHYFYQAADGQHYYLHPLDLQILLHHFKHADQQPPDLHVPIHAIHETTVTLSLRTQFPYLSHLPIGCDVTILEADLHEIVSQDTLSHFAPKLETRNAQHKARARKEARDMLRVVRAKVKAHAVTAERVRNAHPDFSSEYVDAMASANAWLYEGQSPSSIAGSAPASFTNDIEWVASHVASSSSTRHNKSLASFAEVAKASPNWTRSNTAGTNTFKKWPQRPISASPASRPSPYAYELDLFGHLALSDSEGEAAKDNVEKAIVEEEHAESEDLASDSYYEYDEPADAHHGMTGRSAGSTRKSGKKKAKSNF